ncbi:MAG: enolase C-terminal domain-like protein [Chloroflexota bacterium]
MKIRQIQAFEIELDKVAEPPHQGRRAPWVVDSEVANPMSRYPRFKAHRKLWLPPWGQVACVVTAEDGTWGLGIGRYGAPVVTIINDHLGPLLLGEDCLSVERLWDLLARAASPYSAAGLASYAISAMDLALWDLKGKLLQTPVYRLLGGPARDSQPCYATGNDTDWHLEMGFRATKLACPYGPADGLPGMERNAELVAATRELIGPTVDLMLDCWMAFDAEYTVRLAERLQPYRLRWIEDCLIPEDLQSHFEVRRRIPWQGYATGEHWYGTHPFAFAAAKHLADVFQPDIQWVGGVTAGVKICHIAEAAGIEVIPHAGMNDPYGQHLCYAMPNIRWGEYFMGTAPGVPLEHTSRLPGTAVPRNGALVPSDAPGFGLDVDLEWIRARVK